MKLCGMETTKWPVIGCLICSRACHIDPKCSKLPHLGVNDSEMCLPHDLWWRMVIYGGLCQCPTSSSGQDIPRYRISPPRPMDGPRTRFAHVRWSPQSRSPRSPRSRSGGLRGCSEWISAWWMNVNGWWMLMVDEFYTKSRNYMNYSHFFSASWIVDLQGISCMVLVRHERDKNLLLHWTHFEVPWLRT
jgi:hypothetical protein